MLAVSLLLHQEHNHLLLLPRQQCHIGLPCWRPRRRWGPPDRHLWLIEAQQGRLRPPRSQNADPPRADEMCSQSCSASEVWAL